MLKKQITLFFGFFLFITGGLISQAMGAEAVALVSSFSGKVEVQRSGQTGMKAIHLGDQLFENDVLITYKSSKASLLFSDGSIINVYPKSRLKLSLKDVEEKKGGTVIAAISKNLMKGVKGLFSSKKKRETMTVVAGIRKLEEKGLKTVMVLHPRNSMILTTKPTFRWQTETDHEKFMISITLKGMSGNLWSLQTRDFEIPYPEGKEALKRGQTYFLRVQSEDDASIYDEVYFRVLDDKKAEEVTSFAEKMKELQKSNPEDSTPYFVLSSYYKGKGLYHEALEAVESLENLMPGEHFIMEEKKNILAKLGLWDKWKKVNEKLKSNE